MCTLFCMNICLWGSCCQSGCRVCSRCIKNDNVSSIPSAVWSCFAEINRIFCRGMWQWTKPRSITTLQSRSGRQPSGLQSVRSVQKMCALNKEEKSALPPRQCAVSQVARYHGEIDYKWMSVVTARIRWVKVVSLWCYTIVITHSTKISIVYQCCVSVILLLRCDYSSHTSACAVNYIWLYTDFQFFNHCYANVT